MLAPVAFTRHRANSGLTRSGGRPHRPLPSCDPAAWQLLTDPTSSSPARPAWSRLPASSVTATLTRPAGGGKTHLDRAECDRKSSRSVLDVAAWRVVGVYDAEDGRQVGFARAVSDGVHDAYLADVAVEPGSRGRGIRKVLMRTMVEDGPGPGFRWTLFTSDAPDRLPLSGRPVRSGGGMSAAAQRRRCKRSHDANARP